MTDPVIHWNDVLLEVNGDWRKVCGVLAQVVTTPAGAGVVVGRVESITFDDKIFQASVTLGLQNRYSFPKDSSLKILTSGLLGEQYIGIQAGADEKNLQAGDTITDTQSAVVLENLISQFLFSKAADVNMPPAAPATHATPNKK